MGVRAILLILSLGVSAGALPADGSPELYGNNASAGRYASINGINLYYEIYGEGQPLLMIHGNNGSIEDFSNQIALFAKHYRVIVADSRGHGRSGLGEGVLSFAAITDDLFELITQLGLKEIRILGWSDGGVAGLRLAIEHPAIVERLAIMGANTQPPEISAYPWAISAVSETRRQVQQKIDAGDDSPELRRELQVLGLLFSDPLISDEQLAKIVAPVLVMAADKDVIVPEHTQRIFQHIPHSQLAILPGQTHFAPAFFVRRRKIVIGCAWYPYRAQTRILPRPLLIAKRIALVDSAIFKSLCEPIYPLRGRSMGKGFGAHSTLRLLLQSVITNSRRCG